MLTRENRIRCTVVLIVAVCGAAFALNGLNPSTKRPMQASVFEGHCLLNDPACRDHN